MEGVNHGEHGSQEGRMGKTLAFFLLPRDPRGDSLPLMQLQTDISVPMPLGLNQNTSRSPSWICRLGVAVLVIVPTCGEPTTAFGRPKCAVFVAL